MQGRILELRTAQHGHDRKRNNRHPNAELACIRFYSESDRAYGDNGDDSGQQVQQDSISRPSFLSRLFPSRQRSDDPYLRVLVSQSPVAAKHHDRLKACSGIYARLLRAVPRQSRTRVWVDLQGEFQVESQKQTNSPNGRFVTCSIYGSYGGGSICPKTGHTVCGNLLKLGGNKWFL